MQDLAPLSRRIVPSTLKTGPTQGCVTGMAGNRRIAGGARAATLRLRPRSGLAREGSPISPAISPALIALQQLQVLRRRYGYVAHRASQRHQDRLVDNSAVVLLIFVAVPGWH